MQINTTGQELGGGGVHITLRNTPDTCPRCHRSILPTHHFTAVIQEQGIAQALFRCAHHKCQQLFFATYRISPNRAGGYIPCDFVSAGPMTASETVFPESVQGTSPTFAVIYNQALAAEAHQLDQLVGIGLRKALEFLVKDFACSEHPDKAEKIRAATLAHCISTYIADTNIRECAKRAAWLGNDETHYTRKWETKDITDLKLLVRLTVNWIDNFILTKQYISEMPPGNGAA